MSFIISLLILIGLFVLLGLYVYTISSKKKTLPERIGEAVSTIAHETADTVSSLANSITEPKEKKKLRIAKEELARRNSRLFRRRSHPEELQRLLMIDESFRESLKTIGLGENEWKSIAIDIYHLGRIMEISYLNDPTFSNETSQKTRESIINNHITETISWDEIHNDIVDALTHFRISKEEWIKYGHIVIGMHHLFEDDYHKEFGIII